MLISPFTSKNLDFFLEYSGFLWEVDPRKGGGAPGPILLHSSKRNFLKNNSWHPHTGTGPDSGPRTWTHPAFDENVKCFCKQCSSSLVFPSHAAFGWSPASHVDWNHWSCLYWLSTVKNEAVPINELHVYQMIEASELFFIARKHSEQQGTLRSNKRPFRAIRDRSEQ